MKARIRYLIDEGLDVVAFAFVGTRTPFAGWAFERVLRRFM